MKKVFTFIAIASFAFVACQKEAVDNKPAADDNNVANVGNGIPSEIVCEVSETPGGDALPVANEIPTKTQYAGNTTFGWTQYDRIKMPVVKKSGGTITSCDFFSFVTQSASGSTSATFTLAGGSADMEGYDPNPSSADNKWTNMGYLIYPMSIFEKEHSGDYPIVNLPTTISYNATAPLNSSMDSNGNWQSGGIRVPMIGRKVGSTYKFATAVGIIKINIKNIPASATKVQLLSNANSIAGKFVVSESTEDYSGSDVKIAQVTNTSATAAGSGEITLNVSGLTGGNAYDFYFPVPVGTYAANDLSIKVKDSGDNELISMTAKKQIIVARNKVLTLPNMYPDYIQLVLSNNSTNPRIHWSMGTGGIRLHISKSATNTPAEYREENKFGTNVPANKDTGYNLVGLTNGTNSYLTAGGSGSYYLHYMFVTSTLAKDMPSTLSDGVVKSYGTIPFYYLSATDATSFAKQYNFTKTDDSNFWHPGTSSQYATTMTIAASNDVTKGNLMISELYGKTGENKKIYGILNSSATSITFAYNGDGAGQQFFYFNGNYFHVAQGATHDAEASSSDIVFTVTDGPTLTCENYLMMKYTTDYTSWNEFISGVGLIFN